MELYMLLAETSDMNWPEAVFYIGFFTAIAVIVWSFNR